MGLGRLSMLALKAALHQAAEVAVSALSYV